MHRIFAALIALVCVLVLAPAALAANGEGVVRDCLDDSVLNGRYTPDDLRQGLADLPTDADEYTDCRSVIESAIRASSADRGGRSGGGSSDGGGGGGGVGGGSTGGGDDFTGLDSNSDGAPDAGLDAPATSDERGAVADAIESGGSAVPLGGTKIKPDTTGLSSAFARHEVPTPLIVALILLALTAVGGGAWALRNRVPALAGLNGVPARLQAGLSGLRRRVPFGR